MSSQPYLETARRIPSGETRSFAELAAMAGRPGGARAAGRTLAACPVESDVPWHRVVAADGSLARDPARAAEQLARLRAEGARCGAEESLSQWIARRELKLVGRLPQRVFHAAADERVARWRPLRVEPLVDEAQALARGFRPEAGIPTLEPAGSARTRRRDHSAPAPIEERMGSVDWEARLEELARTGLAHMPALLSPGECDSISALFEDGSRFERTIEMGPKGYGVGTYRYWREPPPAPLAGLRAALYERLLPLARAQVADLPSNLEDFQSECRAAGQVRSSSILLRYSRGGINHPHRDIYGPRWFPFQALVVLSQAGTDFEGGDFLLHEENAQGERERRVAGSLGDLIVFASRARHEPVGGRSRTLELRHGMALLERGERFALGIVFHTAL